MVYRIYDYYKKDISIKNLIFKYINWWHLFVPIIFCIILSSLVIYLFKIFNTPLLSLTFLIPAYIFSHFLLKESKKIIKIKYQTIDFKEFNKYRMLLLKTHLEMNNIDNSEKLSFLIKLIEEHISDLKTPSFFNKGLLAALFAPIWIQFVSWYFSINVTKWEDVGTLIAYTIILLSAFLFISYLFKMLIYDDFIDGKYNTYKRLRNDLNEIMLLYYIK